MVHEKTLEEKREQMISFLLENIVVREINGKRMIEDRSDKEDMTYDIIFTAKNKEEYLIKTLSRQAEFPTGFVNNHVNFDEDRRALLTRLNELTDFIEDTKPALVLEELIGQFLLSQGSGDE